MSVSVSVSMCLDAFKQFSRYKAETLHSGVGLPRTGRGGVNNLDHSGEIADAGSLRKRKFSMNLADTSQVG